MIKQTIRNAAILSFVLLTIIGCDTNIDTVFQLKKSKTTGVEFQNTLTETDNWNIIQYLYFYNGGGVAIGDINGDDLPDIFLTANQLPNKLFLNEGNLKFKDITDDARVGGRGDWSTGATMVDVNGDGWLDIYVCNVGGYKGLKGRNELYINEGGTGLFREEAEGRGLDFEGFSTQGVFFDYDIDGDLDMYLLNHSVHSAENRDKREVIMAKGRDEKAGDRLYENRDGIFVDISEQAGIIGTRIGYGLSASVADINMDGYPDIYVCNDFHENDYLYYNNGDGTFTESIEKVIGHTSNFSMGSDIADINNDGLPDIFTLDMKPEDEVILKASQGADAYDIYEFKKSFGYQYQFPRNNVQLNRGAGLPFEEVGQQLGVAATDWSWSVLLADFNNSGHKDAFITNGIYHRPNDLDYLKYLSNQEVQLKATDLELAQKMPDGKVSNYFYENVNGQFLKRSKAYGLDLKGISNGAAYADLDNDGDLDLVVNNINQPVAIYENTTNNDNFLKIKLVGNNKNTKGLGAKVWVCDNQGNCQYQEMQTVRGWQSSVDNVLHFGLEKSEPHTVEVIWQDGSRSIEKTGKGQILTVKQAEAQQPDPQQPKASDTWLHNITEAIEIDFSHQEDKFIDFNNEKLQPFTLTTQSPKIALGKTDIKGESPRYIYIGGASRNAGNMVYQQRSGNWRGANDNIFETEALYEDTDAAFFDADGDGDQDLYVVSGGNGLNSALLQDRLYLNDNLTFTKSVGLPIFTDNGSCITAHDYDQDGDIDLFVGSRSIPNSYGVSPSSRLLVNDGNGYFNDVSGEIGQDFQQMGMVTDAEWIDTDNDGTLELVVVGEWMPITIWKLENGKFIKNEIPNTSGFWNTIFANDLDSDGDIDMVLGNLGTNHNLNILNEKNPIKLYTADFDGNGKTDPLISYYKSEYKKDFFLYGKDDLVAQIVKIKKDYVGYQEFADKSLQELFSSSALEKAIFKEVNLLASVIAWNENGTFNILPLPAEVQRSPIFGIAAYDIDKDRKKELILGGNLYGVQPAIGRFDASIGHILKRNDAGSYEPVSPKETGFVINGEVRDIKVFPTYYGEVLVMVAINNAPVQIFKIKNTELDW